MLHATVKGKSALHERYLGRRDEGERRVHEEDEITSAIFGPLDFMAPAEVARFWHSVGLVHRAVDLFDSSLRRRFARAIHPSLLETCAHFLGECRGYECSRSA